MGTSFRGLFCHVGGTGGPGRALVLGGGALRVRQIGRKLHTEPYGPEQKCTNSAALGPAPPPLRCRPLEGKHPVEGALFFYTLSSDKEQQKETTKMQK